MLQLLNTEGNRQRTEAYMGFENGNPFFGKDYHGCQSGVESVEIFYRANGASVEGLTDRSGHRRKLVGKGKIVSCGGARTKGEGCE